MKNHKLKISPEALSLSPFKKIWDRDKTRNKDKAIAELSFVWLYCDFESDFFDILDEEEKFSTIKAHIEGLPKSWKKDAIIENAIGFYNEMENNTLSMRLLKDGMISAQKTSAFCRQVDLNKTDKNGKFIYNVKQIAEVTKQIPSIIESLEKTMKLVKDAKSKEAGMRGQKPKTMFEDGI